MNETEYKLRLEIHKARTDIAALEARSLDEDRKMFELDRQRQVIMAAKAEFAGKIAARKADIAAAEEKLTQPEG